MAAPLGADPDAWVIHDLRRTATTGMARLGIAPHVADRVLNHTAGTIRGVAAIYNRFEYLDERKAALGPGASSSKPSCGRRWMTLSRCVWADCDDRLR